MISGSMVIHYVDDMDQSLTFYRNAIGLTITTESPGWSTLKVTDTELALHTRPEDESEVSTAEIAHPFDTFATTLVLTVDDMGLVNDPSGNGFQVNQYVG